MAGEECVVLSDTAGYVQCFAAPARPGIPDAMRYPYHVAAAIFDVAMAFISFLIRGDMRAFACFLKEQLHIIMQHALIAFEAELVTAAAVKNLLGDLSLKTHSVNGDGCAAQIQKFYHFRNRRNLVALFRRCRLCQNQARLSDKRADQVQEFDRSVMPVALRLPVHRDQAFRRLRQNVTNKSYEYLAEKHLDWCCEKDVATCRS